MRLKAWQRWGPGLAWAGLIWLLSSLPNLSSGLPQDLLLRKLAHAVAFGVLALLIEWALPKNIRRLAVAIGYAGVVSLAYALIDEMHQTFVAGRHGAATDVLIDGAGITLALLLQYLWRTTRAARS